MQLDPIKPKLKLPGTKLLKPKCDGPLSKFAFKINLYPCMEVHGARIAAALHDALLAGAYTRPLFGSTLAHFVDTLGA